MKFYPVFFSRGKIDAEEITGNHQYGFQRNTSIANLIFCIHRMLRKNGKYSVKVYQLLWIFKKSSDLISCELFYNILIEFGNTLCV
jgi:hypothetical protein